MKSCLISVATILVVSGAFAAPLSFSVADYPSIQAALDANPSKVLEVPPGDHEISEKIRLRGEGSGLAGPGRIIQTNPDQPHLEIEDAVAVEVRDLTLIRPEGRTETRHEAIVAIRCRDLVIENVRVLDNWSNAGTISLRECRDARVSRCLVRNYMRISIDDRTLPFSSHATAAEIPWGDLGVQVVLE